MLFSQRFFCLYFTIFTLFCIVLGEFSFAESGDTPINEFDESAFENIVEKIVVLNQNELEFHLIGGLKFTEKIL